MAFLRATAFRSCFRAARPTVARPQLWQQVARRGYATGAHGSAQTSGDAPWALGAVVVTVPTCWYILQGSETSDGDHGKSHGHKEETKEQPKTEPEEKPQEQPQTEPEEKPQEQPQTEPEEKPQEQPKAEPEEKPQEDKKDDAAESGEGGPKDEPAASKPAGGPGTQSGKQEGLSNTDTKHSTDITNDPEQSNKGEGMPETAKAKGTIDPKRPQA